MFSSSGTFQFLSTFTAHSKNLFSVTTKIKITQIIFFGINWLVGAIDLSSCCVVFCLFFFCFSCFVLSLFRTTGLLLSVK